VEEVARAFRRALGVEPIRARVDEGGARVVA